MTSYLFAARRSLLVASACLVLGPAVAAAEKPVAIAIHGGAGVIERGSLTEEQETAIRAELEAALTTGHRLLLDGASALAAVEAAVVVLEDSPHFNAGRGAVFNNEGKNELDASIMDGRTLNAGAVTGVRRIKNPILLAHRVMTESSHVMLSGAGAESFAAQQGFELVAPEYFYTERRWQQLQKAKAEENAPSTQRAPPKFGTVGAVALDRDGNLAAATSTGGLTNKRFGRIGDTPIIGAGTYADNGTCAISATGHGEYFIRAVVGHDIAALMRYAELPLADAARRVIRDKLTALGGTGGIIGLDGQGNIVQTFNTPGMYRGAIGSDGQLTTAIYEDE